MDTTEEKTVKYYKDPDKEVHYVKDSDDSVNEAWSWIPLLLIPIFFILGWLANDYFSTINRAMNVPVQVGVGGGPPTTSSPTTQQQISPTPTITGMPTESPTISPVINTPELGPT